MKTREKIDMPELYRDGVEDENEFNRIFDIASGLWYKQKKRRDQCVDQLVEMGVKAVGPILHVVEEDASSDDESAEEYDNFNKACLNAVKRIGKPALPILKKYIMEDSANIEVNTFAQEAVFEILELDDKGKKNVCQHREAIKHEIDGEIQDIDSEIVKNGPDVPKAVDALVNRLYEKI